MVREISASPISAISLVAYPRAFSVAGVVKFTTSRRSSGSKYSPASMPRRVIVIYATLFLTAVLKIWVISSSETPSKKLSFTL